MVDGSDLENENGIGTVRTMDINDEMRGSYLDYAMSVIVSRALPDARDGLKPVHRRILFAMYDMGLRPGTPYKKSARIVGEVLGKYHPHGDGAVYDAMARMAQSFSLRYMLVDGQGNFGSVDGDSPAAMRYTEARMATISENMLADIDMNTVDYQDNYDGTQQEPVVLPARLPNLLINGASGIAVGMATSIPPHNLREIIEALVYIIDNYERSDEITVDDLMEYVKGPDFPTGAQIIANEELKEAYATGRGRVAVRAKSFIEEGRNDTMRIVFNSIPYQVSKTSIIERIVMLVREGRLDGVRDLRDESDRNGMRLVVELKRGATPQTVLNRLYKYTQLQSTFSILMLALVKSEPRTLSLKRSLLIYLDHRYEVIVRRSEYELGKRRARAHILQGLLKAIASLDLVIQTIRNAQDVETARAQLMVRFELSEAQSDAILEMQLRRLAALERQKLQTEYDEVMDRIAYLEDLLNSPDKIRALIREDLVEIDEKFGDDRNTEIIYGQADFNEDDLVRDEDVVITLTSNGYIKRVPASEYRAQRRGGKGVRGMTTKEADALQDVFFSSSKDSVLFFSDRGKVYSQKAYRIPETGRANRGTIIQAILPLEQNERITAILPVTSFDLEGWYFVMVTKQGRIKRVHLQDFADVRPSGLIAMSLNADDYLGWVKYSNGQQDIVIVTEQGQSIRFNEDDVRVMGRQAGGVNAIKLADDDRCAGMDVIEDEHTHIMVVTSNGFGKRTPIDQYPLQGRYGSGVRTLARNDRVGLIVSSRAICETDEVMLITRIGVVLRTGLDAVRETGRSTQGVRLMNVADDDQVVGIAIMRERDEVDDEDDEQPAEAEDANLNGAADPSLN
jgi:DNA gyrase subunit A